MGGKGSGGSRVGAGRKSKSDAARWLDGNAGRRGPDAKSAKPAALVVLEPPADMPAEQAAIWLELAPHVATARTLTPAMVLAFRDLCEAIVLKRALLARIEADGLTYQKVTVDGAGMEHVELKAHPLLAQHRGMMQRVETGLMRFRLAPIGKELVEPEKKVDPFDEFEQGTVQ